MAKRKRRGRPVNGILVLDKPVGVSSNDALQEVKRLFYAAKAGHTGSLDPLATGVLPLCFGEATKFSQYLLDADKSYASTFVLGAESSTQDSDGEITPVADASELTEQQVSAALELFLGEQEQVPPMYSALKHNGTRLYELARQGREVPREARKIRVDSITLVACRAFAGERCELEIDLEMCVSKGTYVRSIAEDLGRELGVGGYVKTLRRAQAGPFSEDAAVTIADLRDLKEDQRYDDMDALLKPMDSALSHIPSVWLDESSGFYLRRGQPVQVPDMPSSGTVKLIMETGDFVGVGEVTDDGRIAPRRLVVG